MRFVTGASNTVGGALVFALMGFLVMRVGGWLGGEPRERLGVSVYDDANLNAPSSNLTLLDGRRRAVG